MPNPSAPSAPAAPQPPKPRAWKVTNQKDAPIILPVKPPSGDPSKKRVHGSNYVTIGASCDRGLVGRAQPDVEIPNDAWEFALSKPVVAMWVEQMVLVARPVY